MPTFRRSSVGPSDHFHVLLFPANQLSFANRNDKSVNSLVFQRSIEHGPQCRFMIDRVVCDKKAARHHNRYHCLITTGIDFLLGIEKAEGDAFAARQVIQGIHVNELDKITYTGCVEGLPCKFSLLIRSEEHTSELQSLRHLV